jgi:preprotein translocase subunit SecE
MGVFGYYKPRQGRILRWSAGIALMLLAVFGCHSLYRMPLEAKLPIGWWHHKVLTVPLFDKSINIGMLICATVLILCGLLIYMFIINQPRCAEFLIETEAEMRKVSWPDRRDYLGSSMAVIVCVLIVGAFLLVVDFVFQRLLDLIGVL